MVWVQVEASLGQGAELSNPDGQDLLPLEEEEEVACHCQMLPNLLVIQKHLKHIKLLVKVTVTSITRKGEPPTNITQI